MNLKTIKFKRAFIEALTVNEMKATRGGIDLPPVTVTGYSDYDGPMCCAFSTEDQWPTKTCLSFGGSPIEAEFMAGSNGWWGCNTEEIWNNCCK
jgi:hypothetical protein